MFLISRTFSRQHPFPLHGERPAIASNITSEVPATVVETLKYESNGYLGHNLLGDGEQGWYKIVIASGAGTGGSTGYYGSGRVATYKCYFCPGTRLTYWAPDSSTTYNGPDWVTGLRTAAYGASGVTATVVSGSRGGGGAGTTKPDSTGGGGAGLVATIAWNSETEYRTGVPVVKKTMTGYSQAPYLVYLDEGGNPITLTNDPNHDSDLGFAYSGYIPDPSSTTGGTIAVIGFLQDEPVPYVGQEIKVYYQDDQTVPFYVTTVAEAPKNTVYCKTCHGNLVMQGYSVYDTVGERIGYIAAVTQNFRTRTVIVVQYSGRQESYMLDPNATASFQRQIYYGWEVQANSGVFPQKRIFWTNVANTSSVGTNGCFAYELVNGTMCISTVPAERFYYATRRPDLDTVSDRVAFAVTSDNVAAAISGSSMADWGTNTIGCGWKTIGTGAYFWLLSGGAGYWDGSGNYYAAGCAFGSILQLTQQAQSGGYDYTTAKGPGDSFGGTGGKDGTVAVVDCNDAIAHDSVDAVNAGYSLQTAANTAVNGYVRVYKLSDSTDVTKYAQKIYFPPSDLSYTVTFQLNGVDLPDVWTIPASYKTVERFIVDVKQEDLLTITMHGDNGSTSVNHYTISTETIAFGIWPDSAPWKMREYAGAGDKQLGFTPGYTYAAALISGGGAGGGSNGAININPYAGAGGCSDLRKIKFTAPEHCVGSIHIGKGGVKATNAGAGGASSGGGASRPGCAGSAAGEPTMIVFDKNVNVESMKVRLYSWTNGSTTMYTRNSIPQNIGGLTKFCDENGVLNGKTAYKSSTIPNAQELTCQQDGLVYSNIYYAGSHPANLDVDISGLVPCIFNDASGGGGGSGGTSQGWRQGVGGGGGGGGAWYRVDLENKTFYLVAGANGGAGGPNAAGSPGAGAYNGVDGYGVSAYNGETGSGRAGGAGGYGYGAGGGGGGGGKNDSNSYCGKGGGGAAGDDRGRPGAYNAGTHFDNHMPLYKADDEGRALQYGIGGKGFQGTSEPDSYYNGTDGWIFLYRFDNITETIDCGGTITYDYADWTWGTQTAYAGTMGINSAYQLNTIYNPDNQKWYCFGTGTGSTTPSVVAIADAPVDITQAPAFGAFTEISGIASKIVDVVIFNNMFVVLDSGCSVYTAPISDPTTFTRVAYNISGQWSRLCVADDKLYLWTSTGTSFVQTCTDPAGTWTTVSSDLNITSTSEVMWDGEKFVAVIDSDGGVYTSPDGATWTQVSTQDFSSTPTFIGKFPDTYIFIDDRARVWASLDLVTWERVVYRTVVSNNCHADTDGTNISWVTSYVTTKVAYTYYSAGTVDPVDETIDCGSITDTDITETIDNGAL